MRLILAACFFIGLFGFTAKIVKACSDCYHDDGYGNCIYNGDNSGCNSCTLTSCGTSTDGYESGSCSSSGYTSWCTCRSGSCTELHSQACTGSFSCTNGASGSCPAGATCSSHNAHCTTCGNSSTTCYTVNCTAVNGDWTPWSTCSSCSQSRTCTVASCLGAQNCSPAGGTQTQSCGTSNGYWDKNWQDTTTPANCSLDSELNCGQSETRSCIGQACGGSGCSGPSNRTCNTNDCGEPSAPTSPNPGNPPYSATAPFTTVNPNISLSWGAPATPHGFTTYKLAVDSSQYDLSNTTLNYTFPASGTLTAGHVYHWSVAAYDPNHCSGIVGSACIGAANDGLSPSVDGYFCREADPCTLKCGQAMMCPGNICGTGDTGAPTDAPTVTYPKGSLASPVVIPDVNTVNLQWTTVTSVLADTYQVEVTNVDTNTVVMNTFPPGTGTRATGSVVFSNSTDGLYKWRVRAVNNTCASLGVSTIYYGSWSDIGYFRFDHSPVVQIGANLILENSSGAIVAAETGDRNQICQTEFLGNRRIKVVVKVTDVNGAADIDEVRFKLTNGTTNYGEASITGLGSGAGTAGISGTGFAYWGAGVTTQIDSPTQLSVTFPVEFLNTFPNLTSSAASMYDISLKSVDVHGAITLDWTPANRKLKVWDCKVQAYGTIYDSSAQGGASCPNTGFSDPAPALMEFNGLTYQDSPNQVMTKLDDAHYDTLSDHSNELIWGTNYVSSLSVNAGNQVMRSLDKGTQTTNNYYCSTVSGFQLGRAYSFGEVSAYSDVPIIQIDFSAVRNQEAWFQVAGSGIAAGNKFQSMVPVTCYNDMTAGGSCISSDSIGLSVGQTNSGTVSGPTLTRDSICSSCVYNYPKNWNATRSFVGENTDYNYLYNEYHVKLGKGVILSGDQGLDTVVTNTGGTGVVFVDGKLTIASNLTVTAGNFFLVVAKGNIEINTALAKNIDGVYITSGDIKVSGASPDNTPTVINGSLYAIGNIGIKNDLADKVTNNTAPSVKINYRPDFIFYIPPQLSIGNWRTPGL